MGLRASLEVLEKKYLALTAIRTLDRPTVFSVAPASQFRATAMFLLVILGLFRVDSNGITFIRIFILFTPCIFL
jgi:hypothetical protein